MSRKVYMGVETGTCSVCSAPCSSCMHFNQMGLNTGESSDQSSRGNIARPFSVNGVNASTFCKKKGFESQQSTASETSNLLSCKSSFDSHSENAESKTNFRGSYMYEASEDAEILSKLSSSGTEQLPVKSMCSSDHGTFSNRKDDLKGEECHDENISCVSGTDYTNQSVGYSKRIFVDGKNRSCSSVSNDIFGPEEFGKTFHHKTVSGSLSSIRDVESSRRKQGAPMESSELEVLPINSSNGVNLKKQDLQPKDTAAASSFSKGTSPSGHGLSGKYPSGNSTSTELEEDPKSDMQNRLGAVPALDSNFGQKSVVKNYNNDQEDEHSLDGSSSDKNGRELSDKILKCAHESKGCIESVEFPDVRDPPLQSTSGDENDESDIVEHDVKVCDICGDEGQEDLLAVCSRCSDGAEHTYCMQERLDKVPEGFWLCEECHAEDEIVNQKQGKIELVEKVQCAEGPSIVRRDNFVKLDINDTDVDANRTSNSDLEVDKIRKVKQSSQVTGKRSVDNFEDGPVTKRQALETTIRSPKASSPRRVVASSRDWSFKSLDRGKVNPYQHISSMVRSNDKVLETTRSSAAQRLHTPKGTLLKSNSFSTVNLQPKVKPVNEAISQKQNGAREPAKTLGLKEGPVRQIGKSMSFRSANLGRPSPTEGKVKMLSPKASQELKGFKQAKERANLEKKSSFRLDRPVVSSTTSASVPATQKEDLKIMSRGETSLGNNGESKAFPSDGKLASFAKPSRHLSRKTSEIPVAAGEVKGQSVCVQNAAGASSGSEQNPSQGNLKDEPSSSNSLIVERDFNAAGIVQEGSAKSRESSSQSEKMKDDSAGGRTVPFQKGKEIHQAAEISTSSSPQGSAVDVSDTRCSRERIGNGSRLKAAIEAAMLKKPGIYRKNRLSDPSVELPVSSTGLNNGKVSQDQSSLPIYSKNVASGEEINKGVILQSCTADYYKLPVIDGIKQPVMHPTESEISSKVGNSDLNSLSDGNVSMRIGDLHMLVPAVASVTANICAIPEHEYIWQGGFQVHRSGRLPDLCGGIQAHLSTCASPKVLEVVRKFPDQVPLNEVARSSTWPVQFHSCGAKDDDIALYFFAKDVESYEKNYKCLLESMMKNDLALKGNFDGIELLIFPSNQLVEKSQRWNMLFFLWGVFRGKKVPCSDDISRPSKLSVPTLNAVHQCGNTPTAFMSTPESLCSHRQSDRGSSVCEVSCKVSIESNPFAGVHLPVLSSETRNGTHDTTISTPDEMSVTVLQNLERESCKLDLSRAPPGGVPFCPELRRIGDLKEQTVSNCGPDRVCQHSAQVIGPARGINEVRMRERRGVSDDKFDGNLKDGGGLTEMELEEEEELLVKEAAAGRCTLTRPLNLKDAESLQLNHKRRISPASVETVQQSFSGISLPQLQSDTNTTFFEGGNLSKKLKTGLSEVYETNSSHNASSLGDHFASSLGANFCTKEGSPGSFDEADNPENSVSSARHFFPLDLQSMDLSANTAVPWKVQPSVNEDRHRVGTPNLELALGADTKSPERGVLPFFAGLVDRTNHDNPPDTGKIKEDGEDASASLSLSLSFPFSNKELAANSVSKTEQLRPERQRVNTSLLLFGGFPDG